MRGPDDTLHRNTLEVTVIDNRGRLARTLRYRRHPDSPDVTDERITRHHFNPRGQLFQSIDPRMFTLQEVDPAVNPNFIYLSSLTGEALHTKGADAGTTLSLNDIAGRQVLVVNATGVIHTWQYEDALLPGRLLSITEQAPDEEAWITEQFIWAANTQVEKDLNLAGRCLRHYDTAGLSATTVLH